MVLAGLVLAGALSAQTWKTQIHSTSGKPVVKTIKIKQGVKIHTGTLLSDTQEFKENRYCYGNFLGATTDSIKISLSEVNVNKSLADGTKLMTTIPPKVFLWPQSTDNTMRIALSDIHYLSFDDRKKSIGEGFELGIFASLAVLIVSPFFCIDYKDNWNFDFEKYGPWALGSTIGLVGSVSCGIIFSAKNKKLQFKPGWPNKAGKIWSFR